jgi:predicted dehydrogenase
MRIAIVGAGLIGKERIDAACRLRSETAGWVDPCLVFDPSSAQLKTVRTGIPVSSNPNSIVDAAPDWLVVCTPHDIAPAIAKQTLGRGINVLLEKPLGRNLDECDAIIASRRDGARLNVGFNYRFYPGIEAAILDAQAGRFGALISVNMVLGHGNSPGMDKSWKLDPVRCGGGCLIDPGVHALDLALLLSTGELSVVTARSWNGFWNTGIEEEAHLLLTDSRGVIFNLQLSLNRWRSTFRLEINGTDGYAVVEGRGRSYGPQSYRVGRRWGWQSGVSQAESEVVVINRDPGTNSFLRETAIALGIPQAQSAAVDGKSLQACSYQEARQVMVLLDRVRKVLL